METIPLSLQIDPYPAEVLSNEAVRTGKSREDLIGEAIVRSYASHRTRSEITPKQQQDNFKNLMNELAEMPIQHPDDSLSGCNHDEIIYGDEF